MNLRSPFLFFIVALWIFIFRPVPSTAQTLNFKQFKTSDGLPSPSAYNVFQDAKGYIWVSTMLGVVKHNGRSFVPVCRNVPVPDQNFYSWAEGPDKTLYVATHNNHICRIQNDSAFVLKGTDVFRLAMSDVIVQMTVDKNGDIYFSSFSNTYRYIKNSDTVIKISTGDTAQPDQLNFIRKGNKDLQVRNNFDQNKKARPYSLVYLHNNQQPLKIPHLGIYARVALYQINGFDYFVDGKSIFKIKNGTVVTEKKLTGFLDMRPGPDGNLWLLTTNGAQLLNHELDSVATYLQGRMVSSVCFDRSGGIWMTTLGDGVYYCRDLTERNFFPIGNNTANAPLHLNQFYDKLYFINSENDLYEIQNFTPKKIFHFDEPKRFVGTIEMKDEYMIATTTAMFVLSKKTGRLQEIKDEKGLPLGIQNLNVFSHDTLIAKSGTSLLLIYNNKVIQRYFTSQVIQPLLNYGDHTSLIYVNTGLWKLDWKTLQTKPVDTTMKKILGIREAQVDNQGNTWLSTDVDGLYVLSAKGKLTHLDNLPFVNVRFIEIYKNIIVVSTNMGVFWANLKKSGFPSEWINILQSPAIGMNIQDDFLWIASEDGLLSFDLNQLEDHSDYPINISSLLSNGKLVPTDRSLFHYNESNLHFNFDFLNYKSLVSGFYFELNGPSTMKGNITGHSLQFQHLEPGHYTLKIFPLQGDKYSKDFFLKKNFTIEPAYWQTAWFRILVVMLIVSVTAFIAAGFYNRKRKKAEVSALLAEYKLTALKAQINPHFISNSLAAIQLLIDSGNVDNANRYIAKFSLLIRHVLKYSDKSATRLSDEINIIGLNVELEQLRFVNSFNFKIVMDDQIDPDEIYIPPLITQPFIENAIWHGLLPLKAERLPELIMQVEKTESELVISIIDNGVGRQYKNASSITLEDNIRESKGTVLIQKRIENLNHLYHATAHMEMIDRLDENGHASGTCIRITFPLHMLHQLEEPL